MYSGRPDAWVLLPETGQEEVTETAEATELIQAWAGATEKGRPNPQPQSMLFGEVEDKVSLA